MFFKQRFLSSVCSKGASHGDVSFKRIEYTFWQKVRVYLSCIFGFLAEICFICLKWASH